ncbi:MAG TPA: hypoxanthine phosphoribosyltransferase [Candidatus Krumholzibacterium sp.]|nr:hypoxanthine phosphoribosyltransferase [Candidatus Krumholzibacterium sp.]
MVEYRQIISQAEIGDRVCELAREIFRDYGDKVPLFISLLKGAFIFSADLVRNISIPHEIDFITLYSYENGARRQNDVKMLNHLRADLEGRDIILIDEIVDTGHTLARLIKTLEEQPINSLKICTLLDKPSARKTEVPVHYSGFTIPDVFVVGYGLDFMERYRNLPFIAELTPGQDTGVPTGPAPDGR